MSGRLTQDEVRAWCEKYASTPWNGLALAVAANSDPSPLVVLKSAVLNADEAEATNTQLGDALETAVVELEYGLQGKPLLEHAKTAVKIGRKRLAALAPDAEQGNA